MKKYTFTDTQFMSAKDKQLTLTQWASFLKFLASPAWIKHNDTQGGSDYGMEAPRQFTDRIYKHLSLHCGFIAHYNIHGFYSEYFSGDVDRWRHFIHNVRSWGDTKDLTDAMLMESHAYLQAILDTAYGDTKARDLAMADRLRAKYD